MIVTTQIEGLVDGIVKCVCCGYSNYTALDDWSFGFSNEIQA